MRPLKDQLLASTKPTGRHRQKEWTALRQVWVWGGIAVVPMVMTSQQFQKSREVAKNNELLESIKRKHLKLWSMVLAVFQKKQLSLDQRKTDPIVSTLQICSQGRFNNNRKPPVWTMAGSTIINEWTAVWIQSSSGRTNVGSASGTYSTKISISTRSWETVLVTLQQSKLHSGWFKTAQVHALPLPTAPQPSSTTRACLATRLQSNSHYKSMSSACQSSR